MIKHAKIALSLCAAMILGALPAQAQMDPDEYTNGVFGAMSPQFRTQAIAMTAKLQNPGLSVIADTPDANPIALKAALSANVAALGDKCDTGRLPADQCKTLLDQMENILGDNRVNASEVKPWLDKVNVLAK